MQALAVQVLPRLGLVSTLLMAGVLAGRTPQTGLLVERVVALSLAGQVVAQAEA